jgi:ATP-binding cassette subfamily B (MDR/TAP) protein 1
MNGGKVVEEGSHEELLASPGGLYARLVEAQGLKKLVETNATGTATATGSGIGGMGTPVDPRARTPTRPISLSSSGDIEKGEENEKTIGSMVNPLPTTTSPLQSDKPKTYSVPYLFFRMSQVVSDKWARFLTGAIFAILVGLIYPVFGVVYALSIDGFSQPDPHVRRVQGDRNALW